MFLPLIVLETWKVTEEVYWIQDAVFFSTTKFQKQFSPRCIFTGLRCKCAKIQVMRHVTYSLFCEILNKTKFEFFY